MSNMILNSVTQEEATGYGIASVANILRKIYSEMKAIANAMGIHAADEYLWSDTQYVRRMLFSAGIETSENELPFDTRSALPEHKFLSRCRCRW